jgi:hypothetical protein
MARNKPCRTDKDKVKVEVWIDDEGVWIEEKFSDPAGDRVVKTVLVPVGDFVNRQGSWTKVDKVVPQGRPVVVISS